MKQPYRDPRLVEFGENVSRLWWHLVDWVAQISWVRLGVVWFLAMIVGGILNVPLLVMVVTLVLAIIKVLAGSKLDAEIEADVERRRADVESLERRLAEARIAALQAQIEPHFLFNTLSSIAQLIESDPVKAASMQRNLIDYLRSALPHMRESRESTLGSQLAMSQAYLDIMKERMEERLTVSVVVEEGLESAVFPPMMLQTLVENAIQHGLEPLEQGGCITLEAHRNKDELRVSVSDDGVGFSPSAGRGVGLANIRDRLELLYGERAELIIEMREPSGTRVTIRLPSSVVSAESAEPEEVA